MAESDYAGYIRIVRTHILGLEGALENTEIDDASAKLDQFDRGLLKSDTKLDKILMLMKSSLRSFRGYPDFLEASPAWFWTVSRTLNSEVFKRESAVLQMWCFSL